MMTEQGKVAEKPRWADLLKAVQQEVRPAIGCTEPVAVALGAAIAARELGKPVERIEVQVSANMMKNGMGVMVPGTGMAGLAIAAAAGAISGDPEGKLEVLKNQNQADVKRAKQMVAKHKVHLAIAEVPHVLYADVKVFSGSKWARVCIADDHTQVVRVEREDEVLYEKKSEEGAEQSAFSLEGITASEVYEFATTAPLDSLRFIVESAKLNDALADEGLKGGYGLHIGATLQRQSEEGLLADSLMNRVLLRTTAASDARMGGASLPAMTNSGSGNQGITATVPVSVVAQYVQADEEKLIRALMLSHTMAIYIHSKLPKLSALCAVSTAAMGAASGMAWLLRKDFGTVSMAISSMVGDMVGMICDGASNSCAMKVSTAVSSACKAVLMALEGTRVTGCEGIVAEDVDVSIANVGELACKGMVQTDDQILKIMLHKVG